MRLQEFLNEKIRSVEEIKETIERDCSFYLYYLRKGKNFYKRDLPRLPKARLEERKVRKDRKPADTPVEFHNALDNFLYKKFGWYPRSQGLFVWASNNLIGAQMPILPIGKFSVVFHKDITDIYTKIAMFIQHSYGYDIDELPNSITRDEKRRWAQEFIEEHKPALNNYTDSIIRSLRMPNTREIMINCDKYYILNTGSSQMMELWDEIRQVS